MTRLNHLRDYEAPVIDVFDIDRVSLCKKGKVLMSKIILFTSATAILTASLITANAQTPMSKPEPRAMTHVAPTKGGGIRAYWIYSQKSQEECTGTYEANGCS